MRTTEATRPPLMSRLATYTSERFPLLGNALLTALMCAGSIAPLATTAPLWKALLSLPALLALFFIMRVADEHKDYADDLAYRPERPVPRGLISLRELRLAAACASLIPVALAFTLSPATILPLLAAAVWIGAMSREFGVKAWLRARPVAYLVSHMLVMPLLALVAGSFSVTATADLVTPQLAGVLALAFAAGLVLELGRKLWGTDEERMGVDTYSGLWGASIAATAWTLFAIVALMLGATVSGLHAATLALAAALGAAVIAMAVRYARAPETRHARPLRACAIVVVIAAYALAILGAVIQ